MKLESSDASSFSVTWPSVDVTLDMPSSDALLRDVRFSVVGFRMRLSPFASLTGDCVVPISALAGAHATSLTKSFELVRDTKSGVQVVGTLRVTHAVVGIAALEWTVSAFESELKAERLKRTRAAGAGRQLVLELPASSVQFATALESLRRLASQPSAADALLTAPILASLTQITLLTADNVVLVADASDPRALDDADATATADADASAPATAAAADAAKPKPVADAALMSAIQKAERDAAEKRGKFVGYSYFDSQAMSPHNVTPDTSKAAAAMLTFAVGQPVEEQRRREIESSRAVKQAQRVVALGSSHAAAAADDDAAPLRYEPHAHLLLVWKVLAVDGGDAVRRALVRAGVFAQLATLISSSQTSADARDCAMACARHFFKFPRWQELMISDGLLGALTETLSNLEASEAVHVKCLELLACFDMQHQATLIDCGVVQAVVHGIRGASWQLKMRSLAFVCHFDSKYQSRLVECGLLPLLITGAAVGERDAMRCAQCLNLMARMPGQSAALLEQGALPMLTDLLLLPSPRILTAALTVLASIASLATARRVVDAGILPRVAALVRGRRADTDMHWRTPPVVRAALAAISALLHSTGTDVAVDMIAGGANKRDFAVAFSGKLKHDDDDDDDADDKAGGDDDDASHSAAARGKAKMTRVGKMRARDIDDDEYASAESDEGGAAPRAVPQAVARALLRANSVALVESGCIDAVGVAAMSDQFQDEALALLRDVDSSALLASDVPERFIAALNGDILPLPTRDCDVTPPLSATPVLEHEKRVWPTAVTSVEAEALWFFLVTRVPPAALLARGLLRYALPYILKVAYTKADAMLKALFDNVPLGVLQAERFVQRLFLVIVVNKSTVSQAFRDCLLSNTSPEAAQLLGDVRTAMSCGGPHAAEFARAALKYVGLLDDAALTQTQFGWGENWDRGLATVSARASIIDLVLNTISRDGTDALLAKELMGVVSKLSRGVLVETGTLVRLLRVAHNRGVPDSIVAECVGMLRGAPSSALLTEDVFGSLFDLYVRRTASIVVRNPGVFDARLRPVLNDVQFAHLIGESAPSYANAEAACDLLSKRAALLGRLIEWRSSLTVMGAVGADGPSSVLDSWPGAAALLSRDCVSQHVVAMTLKPSAVPRTTLHRTLFADDDCVPRARLVVEPVTVMSADSFGALFGAGALDPDLERNEPKAPATPALASPSDVELLTDSGGGVHALNLHALYRRFFADVGHAALVIWDLLRLVAAHVPARRAATQTSTIIDFYAPPLVDGAKYENARALQLLLARCVIPLLNQLEGLARLIANYRACSVRFSYTVPAGAWLMVDYTPNTMVEYMRTQMSSLITALEQLVSGASGQSTPYQANNAFRSASCTVVSLLKVAHTAPQQITSDEAGNLAAATLQVIRTTFSVDEMRAHGMVDKLLTRWRSNPTLPWQRQEQLLSFLTHQPPDLVWSSEFIVTVQALLSSAPPIARKPLLGALVALLRTDARRASELQLHTGGSPAPQAALERVVALGLSFPSPGIQGDELPFVWAMTEVLPAKLRRLFWLRKVSFASNEHETMLSALIELCVKSSAANATFHDPAMRALGYLSQLVPQMRDEICAHLFALTVLHSGDKLNRDMLTGAATLVQWLANRRVQPVSVQAPLRRLTTDKSALLAVMPHTLGTAGATLWFDTPAHWLTHVIVERQALARVDILAVYALVHELPDDADAPLSDAELAELPLHERRARQRVRWSSGQQRLPTAVTHVDLESRAAELALDFVPSGGWSARVAPPPTSRLPVFVGATSFQPLSPPASNVDRFAMMAGVTEPIGGAASRITPSAAAAVIGRDVRWHFEDNDGSFMPCDADASQQLELAFQRKQSAPLTYTSSGQTYRASVLSSPPSQTNTGTNRKRTLMRGVWFKASALSPTEVNGMLVPLPVAVQEKLEELFRQKAFASLQSVSKFGKVMLFADGTGTDENDCALYRGFIDRVMPIKFVHAGAPATKSLSSSASLSSSSLAPPVAAEEKADATKPKKKKKSKATKEAEQAQAPDESTAGAATATAATATAGDAAAPPPPKSRVRITLVGFVRISASARRGEVVLDPPVFAHNVLLQAITSGFAVSGARIVGVVADETGAPPLSAGEVPLHLSVPVLASDPNLPVQPTLPVDADATEVYVRCSEVLGPVPAFSVTNRAKPATLIDFAPRCGVPMSHLLPSAWLPFAANVRDFSLWAEAGEYFTTNRPLSHVFARIVPSHQFAPVLMHGILRTFLDYAPDRALLAAPRTLVAPRAMVTELERVHHAISDGNEALFVRATPARAAFPIPAACGLGRDDARVLLEVGAPCWAMHTAPQDRNCAGWVFVWPRGDVGSSKATDDAAGGGDDDDDADDAARDGKKKLRSSRKKSSRKQKKDAAADKPAEEAAASEADRVPRSIENVVIVPLTFIKDALLLSNAEFDATWAALKRIESREAAKQTYAVVEAAAVASDAAVVAAPEAPLPAGWKSALASAFNNVPYYFNVKTKETTWKRPVEPASTASGGGDARADLLSQLRAGVSLKPTAVSPSTEAAKATVAPLSPLRTTTRGDADDYSYSYSYSDEGPPASLSASAVALGFSVRPVDDVVVDDGAVLPPPLMPPPGADGDRDGKTERAAALFDYTAAESDELTVAEGDVVNVVSKFDDDWWLCTAASGHLGLLPSNYLQVVASSAPASKSLAQLGAETPVVNASSFRARFKYAAVAIGEISVGPGDDVTVLEKRDNGWWLCTANGCTGLLPQNFLEPAPVSIANATDDDVQLSDLDQLVANLSMSATGSAAPPDSPRSPWLASGIAPKPLLRRSTLTDLRPTGQAPEPFLPVLIPPAPPMPTGRLVTRSALQAVVDFHQAAKLVRSSGDGLDLFGKGASARASPPLPLPPPPSADDDAELPVIDAETRRKYEHDLLVHLWLRPATLSSAQFAALAPFVEVGARNAKAAYSLVSANWLLRFLVARSLNLLAVCGAPDTRENLFTAGKVFAPSLLRQALHAPTTAGGPESKSTPLGLLPGGGYDKSVTAISSDALRTVVQSSASSAAATAAATSAAAAAAAAAALYATDVEGVRERLRVVPTAVVNLMQLHWPQLPALPLSDGALALDGAGDVTDESLMAALTPCDEVAEAARRRDVERHAFQAWHARGGVGSATPSYKIVNGKWFEKWRAFVTADFFTTECAPAIIDNGSLFNAQERPIPNLSQGTDYVAIDQRLWNDLVGNGWYKADLEVTTKYQSIYGAFSTVKRLNTPR